MRIDVRAAKTPATTSMPEMTVWLVMAQQSLFRLSAVRAGSLSHNSTPKLLKRLLPVQPRYVSACGWRDHASDAG
jgi:hypothetical protein